MPNIAKNFNATKTGLVTVDSWILLGMYKGVYNRSHVPNFSFSCTAIFVYNTRRYTCTSMRTLTDESAPVMFVGSANCRARDVKYDRSYLSYSRLVLHAITICIGA